MQYFQNCKDIKEVKQLFRELAKQMHPDMGGSTEQMQVLNAEYSFAIAKLSKGENLSAEDLENTILEAEKYREAIFAVINLNGVCIEVVGSWLWLTGNTYINREPIKAAGFMFASAKKAWFFRTDENKCPSRSKKSLDEIRSKYGSQQINNNNYKRSYIH